MADRWMPTADCGARRPYPVTARRGTGTARQHARDLLLLIVLCSALYLPGLAALPPIDRDEARFMQTTRQMVESGDYVHPRFQEEDRFRKPIGIYWLQALSVRMAADSPSAVWAYRLPSVLGASMAVLLTYLVGVVWYSRGVALTAAALLASSILLVVEAHLATTDAVLLALIVAAQGCLGALSRPTGGDHGRPQRYVLGFWVAQGIAILIKGPVAPLISALTITGLVFTEGGLAFSENLRAARSLVRRLRPLWGVPLMLMVILPWGIAIAHDSGGTFFRDWWSGDVLPKLIGGHESHGAPPGTHLALLLATFWPASIALVPAFVFVRRRRRRAERFLLAWLVPAWLAFELMPTKLPHYILPLLPPLALLCARALLAVQVRKSRWSTAVTAAVAASVLLSIISLSLVLPRIGALWVSPQVAAAIATHRPRPDAPLAAAGYHEPSLVFLLGGNINLMEANELARFMRDRPDGLGLIAADARTAFEAAAATLGIAPRVVWSGNGLNYSKGRRIELLLLSNRPPTEVADVGDAAPADHQALVAR